MPKGQEGASDYNRDVPLWEPEAQFFLLHEGPDPFAHRPKRSKNPQSTGEPHAVFQIAPDVYAKVDPEKGTRKLTLHVEQPDGSVVGYMLQREQLLAFVLWIREQLPIPQEWPVSEETLAWHAEQIREHEEAQKTKRHIPFANEPAA